MKTHERLAFWLPTKNKNYREGVQIFIDLNIDTDKIPFFSIKKPGKIHHNLLRRQLENFARVNKVEPQLRVASPNPVSKAVVLQEKGKQKPAAQSLNRGSGIQRPRIDTNPVVKYDELPENLKIMFNETGQLNNEIKTLHAELKLIRDEPDKKERRQSLSSDIVYKREVIKKNWESIDSWWNSRLGKSPEEIAANEAIKKERRIKANLNYIRRYHGTDKEKQQKVLTKRKKELNNWGIDYEKLIKKVSENTTDAKG